MRVLTIISLSLGTCAASAAADPPKAPLEPTRISAPKGGAVLGEMGLALSKQSGVPIAVAPGALKSKCDVSLDKTPFWEGLQRCAGATGTRIALTDGGRKVELVPRGAAQEVAATSGAFRVVAQQVVGRTLLDQGVTFHEVLLQVHWEPRVRVYRIDTAPWVARVADDRGSKITPDGGGAPALPGSATSEMRVRLNGLTRKSERITSLAGEFTVTAADKMLAFTFEAPAGKLPGPKKQEEVTAALKRVQKKGDTWEVVVEVTYPAGQPVFESFQGQWWLRDNRLHLRSPEGKTVALDDYEIPGPDRATPLVVIHRFKEDPKAGFGDPTDKGWALVYETPAPLVEVKVPFELKDIPLP